MSEPYVLNLVKCSKLLYFIVKFYTLTRTMPTGSSDLTNTDWPTLGINYYTHRPKESEIIVILVYQIHWLTNNVEQVVNWTRDHLTISQLAAATRLRRQIRSCSHQMHQMHQTRAPRSFRTSSLDQTRTFNLRRPTRLRTIPFSKLLSSVAKPSPLERSCFTDSICCHIAT